MGAKGIRRERNYGRRRQNYALIKLLALVVLAALAVWGICSISGSQPEKEEESEVASVLENEENPKYDKLVDERTEKKDDGQKQVRKKFHELMEQFPTGSYWNHMGIEVEEGEPTWDIVTDIPCDHGEYDDYYCNRYNGVTQEFFPEYDYLTQCLGFSSMISDQLFGEDAPIRAYEGYENIRLGDQIRFTDSWHSVIVYDIQDDFILVAEVDRDYTSCEISWGRKITFETLNEYGDELLFLTRYPD